MGKGIMYLFLTRRGFGKRASLQLYGDQMCAALVRSGFKPVWLSLGNHFELSIPEITKEDWAQLVGVMRGNIKEQELEGTHAAIKMAGLALIKSNLLSQAKVEENLFRVIERYDD